MTVDARHLRAFLAIAAEGSVTGAAAALGVSQPAVSRLLRQLEDRLGTRLVDRSTHHVRLTDAGERYTLRAAGAVRALDRALDPAAFGERPLRIGYAWSAFGGRTAALLVAWRERHPASPIELHRADDRLGGLLRADIDAVIVRDMDPDLDVPRRWVHREPRVAALPVGHPLAARASVTLADLADETVVLNTTSGVTTLALWPTGGEPGGTVEVRNTDDWLFTIASGAGVGVSSIATAEVHTNPDVAYRPLTDAPAITVEVAWLDPHPHPLAEAFAAHCRQMLGRA